MEPSSQRQFTQESANWLGRGRAHLLAGILRRYLRTSRSRPTLLDIGAGYGQNVDVLARFGTVDAVEVSDFFAEELRKLSSLRVIYQDPIPELQVSQVYDAIVAFDVLEHIERDDLAIHWVYDHLAPGGIFIGSVPAYQWLFSDHDRALHHFRRYTLRQLSSVVGQRLEVCEGTYFNTVLFPVAVSARLGWQLRRRVSGTSTPQKQSSSTSNRLEPIFEHVLRWEGDRINGGKRAPFGLSAVCVARRPMATGVD
jgi:SAM-dependent methyltransferase